MLPPEIHPEVYVCNHFLVDILQFGRNMSCLNNQPLLGDNSLPHYYPLLFDKYIFLKWDPPTYLPG
eukprot:c53090_g1_i1 orf=126-323(+)